MTACATNYPSRLSAHLSSFSSFQTKLKFSISRPRQRNSAIASSRLPSFISHSRTLNLFLSFSPVSSCPVLFMCSCEDKPSPPIRPIGGWGYPRHVGTSWRFRPDEQSARLFSDCPVRADRRFRERATDYYHPRR